MRTHRIDALASGERRNILIGRGVRRTIPFNYRASFVIIGFLLLSLSEASLPSGRGRRSRTLSIESVPPRSKGGKGSGKGREEEYANGWSDPSVYFSLAPPGLETRITDSPAASLSLESPSHSPSTSLSQAPSSSPSKTSWGVNTRLSAAPSSFTEQTSVPIMLSPRVPSLAPSAPRSDEPSLAPSKFSSDEPSNGPSAASMEIAPRLSSSPSSAEVPTRAPLIPSVTEPASTRPSIDGSEASPGSAVFQSSSPTASIVSDSDSESAVIDNSNAEGDSGPTNMTSDSAVMCPGFTSDRLEVVSWTYSVTMARKNYSAEDADIAVQALEPILGSGLLDLLECDNSTGRRLASSFGIVGMDHLPDDLREKECASNSTLPCFVYVGEMFIFLEKSADTDIAILETRKAIKSLMSEVGTLSIPKVKRVKYLLPKLSDSDSIEAPRSAQSNIIQTGQDGSSPAIPVLSAMGGLFVVLGMVAAYRLRKQGTETVDGPSTVAGGSTMAASQASLSMSPTVPVSPFAGILPGAYQTREQYPMGAILEDTSDSASYSRTSDIVVSDCGYTDEESSRDHSYHQAMLHDDSSILGARGMDDYDAEDDVLFDETELTPSKRKVSFATAQAEV